MSFLIKSVFFVMFLAVSTGEKAAFQLVLLKSFKPFNKPKFKSFDQ